MIDQIARDVKKLKAQGVEKVRVILWTTVDERPQVVNISEFETGPGLLKSGKLAIQIARPINGCAGDYDKYTIICLTR